MTSRYSSPNYREHSKN